MPSTPTDLRQSKLSRAGDSETIDSSIALSRYTHIGCFEADISIQKHRNLDSNYDPNECIDYCQGVVFTNASRFEVIAAVHQDICGCVRNDMTEFSEVDQGLCTFYCKYYRNPICGGLQGTRTFWGVFKEYDYQSLGAQGAYDPWRYVWYSIAVIRERSIQGMLVGQDIQPERYYLHAVDTNSGLAQFQFQLQISQGILYGLQYDIDSSRLAALFTRADTGRMRADAEWQYKLATIVVNTTDGTFPRMQFTLAPINIVLPASMNYLAFSGASAIISRKVNCFIFTQSEPAAMKKDMKDRMYFVRIPDGYIIFEAALDFKVMQILANEKYGDVTAIGPRLDPLIGSGLQSYMYLGRVYRSDIEDRELVDWQYNPLNPPRVVQTSVSGDWLLHPGISASDHLFNKSAIAYRHIPPDAPDRAATTIMEINIRTKDAGSWCDSFVCQGSLSWDVPYAGIYNKEPGIPLSLKSPSFLSARFTIEAQSIIVDWDRATLKGARTVDDDGDMVPDRIDYSTQPQGEFNCGEVFDVFTVLKLGPYPETQCLWQSASRIVIQLPTTGINITVGDDLFVLPDTIYTPPLNDEWSPAASGGVEVQLPDPLVPPVIILTGATTIDRCTPVTLSAQGSFQTGGLPRYAWTFPEGTPDDENPKDLTNSPTRQFDPDKIQLIKDALAETTATNSATLTLDALFLEEATAYKITLKVTSRWGLSMNKTVLLTKLSFPAPMVSILGPEEIWKNRTQTVSLEANGVPSGCEGDGFELQYQWSCTSGNLVLEDYPRIKTLAANLVIPPFTLLPPADDSEYTVYTFAVECWNGNYAKTPERTAFATVTVKVRRSPVYVVFRTGSRILTRGDILVLDARGSQDPDFPTQESQTFKGTFQWRCLTPIRSACFGGSSTGMLTNVERCRQDIGSKIQDGLVTFQAPLFDDLEYCQYARGVLMFQTSDFEVGEYKFSVEITSFDGRRASADVFIEITNVRVPRIVLTMVNLKERYTVSEPIRIVGTEEGQTDDVARTYSWSVMVYERNPKYQNELAQELGNDLENPYTTDKYTFIDVTQYYDTRDTERFDFSENSPNLLIRENVLAASRTYKFRLNINLETVSGYSDITFTTAGLPPRGGRLDVDPQNATMDTERKLDAPYWVADDLPLTYDFGYVAEFPGETKTVQVKFTTAALPVPKHTQYFMPLGDPLNNYSLFVFVHVGTPYGAVTTAFTTIQSSPPENVTESVNEGLDRAAQIDPSNVLNTLDYVLSMDPDNPDTHDKILDIMEAADDNIPVTPNQLVTQARIISTIVDSGNVNDKVLNALEALVIKAADAGAFTPDRSAPGGPLASLMLSAMGGLLPGGGLVLAAADPGAASGQSTVMGRYLSPNPSFAFRDVSLSGWDQAELQLQTGLSRQRINHPSPAESRPIISSCPTAFCDQPLLACYPKERPGAMMHICCDEPNPNTLCNEPPCWFIGMRCPGQLSTERSIQGFHEADRASRQRRSLSVRVRSATMNSRSSGTWLDSWVGYNFPLRTLNEEDVSDWERVHGYHGWHPNIYRRRLQALAVNRTQSDSERIQALEAAERELLKEAKELERLKAMNDVAAIKAAAVEQASFDSMESQLAQRLRDQTREREEVSARLKEEAEVNASQRITRIIVMRDTIAKALIKNLVSNEEPLVFESAAYTMTIGKTTNLSAVHSAFVFPKEFQVPPDSPDEPTRESNVTGFAFMYIEYKKNIYDWSDSNPPSNESMLITLIVMKANTDDLEVRKTPNPIRIFADKVLFSNAICLYWDRFAAKTVGGQWSTQGVVNNGTGCITTHLSDIAVFMDGRAYSGTDLVDAASDWEREVWESTCIGCGSEMNLFVIVVLGCVLFMNLFLVLLGYVLDETQRSEMKKNRVTSRYYYDGDGLEKPLNVDDPIAYSERHNLFLLCGRTMVNVTLREHAVISTFFYRETFSRPQRVWCFASLLTGLMGINAIVHGNPGYVGQMRQYVITGILSGLLMYPVFCGLLLMFNMRPASVKRRLIKKAYSTREIDLLTEQRQKLAHQSALRPAPNYMALPPPPPGSIPGQTTLLSVPAPLPLPPLPSGGTGALGVPALPPPTQTAGGGSGMLALPALPGMTANLPLPPPPKYPPPPKNAKVPAPAALMPPLTFKAGPPPPPFPKGQALDASSGGTFSNLPLPGAPDTGATPLQLPDAQMGLVPALGLTGEAPVTPPGPLTPQGPPRSFGADALPSGADVESTPPQAALREDASHGMAPGDLPGTVGGSSPPSMPTPQRPPGSMTPPGMSPRTPLAETPIAGTPRSATGHSVTGHSVTGHSVLGIGPSGGPRTPLPPQQTTLVPQDSLPMPLFMRGAPPPGLPAPFPPAPPGPSGMSPWVMPGMAPPGLRPPIPSAGGMLTPGAPLPPLQPPIPPPPPREDDQAFVRRIRLTYTDKVIREHEKHDLLEDMEKLGTATPDWVFDALTVMPYLACCTFVLVSIIVVLQYGVKFQKWQEEFWIWGSLTGLAMVLLLLEFFRIAMTTLVELRKFENRKKAKAGHFLPRRVKRDDDKNYQEVPPPRLLKRAFVSPAIPKGAIDPNAQVTRPAFLPSENRLPALPAGGRTPPGARTPPGLRSTTASGGQLPVAKGPPAAPQFSSQALAAAAGAFGEPPPPPAPGLAIGGGYSPGPATPKSVRSMTGGGLPGVLGGAGSTSGGTPTPGTPKLQSAAELLQQNPGGPAPPSPTHSTHSLRSAVQSLNQQVKAGRRNTPPPRPVQPRTPGAQASPVQPPPAPSAPPPNYSRPPSRPSSAGGASIPPRFAQPGPKAPS